MGKGGKGWERVGKGGKGWGGKGWERVGKGGNGWGGKGWERVGKGEGGKGWERVGRGGVGRGGKGWERVGMVILSMKYKKYSGSTLSMLMIFLIISSTFKGPFPQLKHGRSKAAVALFPFQSRRLLMDSGLNLLGIGHEGNRGDA